MQSRRDIKMSSDDDSVNVFETAWFKNTKARMTPGRNLHRYRHNRRLTRRQLAEKLGPSFSGDYIAAMEFDTLYISKETAKKLAAILDAPVDRFLTVTAVEAP